MNIFPVTNFCIRLLPVISYVSHSWPVSGASIWYCWSNKSLGTTAGETPAIFVHCHAYKLTLIGWKRARCKERVAKTGSIDPLSRDDAASGPFSANPVGGGQGSVSFVARRQCIHQYTILLASRPGPLGLPSKRIYRRDSALGYYSKNANW